MSLASMKFTIVSRIYTEKVEAELHFSELRRGFIFLFSP